MKSIRETPFSTKKPRKFAPFNISAKSNNQTGLSQA